MFMHPVFFFLSNFVSRDETYRYKVVPVGISLVLISNLHQSIVRHSSASEPTLRFGNWHRSYFKSACIYNSLYANKKC